MSNIEGRSNMSSPCLWSFLRYSAVLLLDILRFAVALLSSLPLPFCGAGVSPAAVVVAVAAVVAVPVARSPKSGACRSPSLPFLKPVACSPRPVACRHSPTAASASYSSSRSSPPDSHSSRRSITAWFWSIRPMRASTCRCVRSSLQQIRKNRRVSDPSAEP